MYGIETIKELNERAADTANAGTGGVRHGGDSARPVTSQAETPQVTEVTSKSWKSEVLDSPVLVVADFYTDWCGPCRYIKPTVDQLVEEFEGRTRFVKIDVDKNRDIAYKYNIKSIPTLIIFKPGRVVARNVRAR